MAGNMLFSEDEKQKSVPKSVQEMSKDGDEPPSQYHGINSLNESVEDCSAQIPIPIIDVSLLSSSKAEQEKLRSALTSTGCFQTIGHGVSSSYLDKIRQVAKQFFALPEEEKQKYARAPNEFEGYGDERVVSEKQILDWNYRLFLQVFPKEKRRLSLWPKNPSEFSETLEEYSRKVESLANCLLRSMARSLNLEEDSFLNQFGERPLLEAKMNFYPPCSRPDLVFGVKAHTDGTGITILLQDKDVEGLQVLIDNNKWVNVPTIPDAFVVNLGDQMQIMSNGIFKSPTHRVKTNREKLRMSVAMFMKPDREHEIGPVESLISETRPRLYKNVQDYAYINYKAIQDGKIPLEMVQIAHYSNQKRD